MLAVDRSLEIRQAGGSRELHKIGLGSSHVAGNIMNVNSTNGIFKISARISAMTVIALKKATVGQVGIL